MRSLYSTLQHLVDEGEREGRLAGAREGASRQLARLLSRHGKRRFGPPAEEVRELLDRLVDRVALESLERIQERFGRVTDWDTLLADVLVPEQRPVDPGYLVPCDYDPSPPAASIDQFKIDSLGDGRVAIVHLRIQRLYQENLGAILYRARKEKMVKYRLPMVTMVMLIHPGADGPTTTGEYAIPTGGTFRYDLIRIWEREPEELLAKGPLVSLAPIGKGARERLPDVVRQMEEVIERTETEAKSYNEAWSLAFMAMGLVYTYEEVHAVLAHRMPFLRQLDESRSALSEGFYEGRSRGQQLGALEVTRRWVLERGKQRLGEPPADVLAALSALTHLDRLDQLAARVLTEASWPAVLATR